METLPLKEVLAILASLSTILFNGLSADQRTDVLENLPLKDDIHNGVSEFDIYDALSGYYKKTRSLDFIVLLTLRIRATESFYRDVGAELDNLFYLIKKNNISIESKGVVAKAFVLMPFKQSFFAIYESVIRPVVKELGCSVKQANEIRKADVIIETVFSEIQQADFLIADATGKNPNVFYEIGYAHALGKKVIIIVQNREDIPFDIARIRYIEYSPDDRNVFAEVLREFVKETLTELKTSVSANGTS